MNDDANIHLATGDVARGTNVRSPVRKSPYHNLQARLVYADPPTNRGLNEGNSNDQLSSIQYQRFALAWLRNALNNTAPDSWVVITLYYRLRRLYEHLIHLNFPYLTFHQEVIWHYNFGLYTRRRWVPEHDNILIFKYGNPPYYWKENAIPSQRLESGDPRADSRGRNPGTVWDIPRQPGNSKQRHFIHTGRRSSQPLALCERILRAYTQRGETIYDPFAGSGSMALAAARNGRTYFGVDICEYYVREAKERVEKQSWMEFMREK